MTKKLKEENTMFFTSFKKDSKTDSHTKKTNNVMDSISNVATALEDKLKFSNPNAMQDLANQPDITRKV